MSTFQLIKSTSSKIKEVTLTLILAASLLGVTLNSSANAETETNVSAQVNELVTAKNNQAN